eukprot:TRINITY_DN5131_c0_g1_i1.p1 TRINITY_DN5131_c0_g1~~TRINITY_DN5131_c0_g1_i1.p1  ORF type:complete len:512 (+),score=111.68 TRINITY_DN5131_c0_g1_i1:29-1537(+)
MAKDAHYYMRFAAAVYGWKLIYGYSFKESTKGIYRGFTNGDDIQPEVFAEHSGIEVEDILSQQWTSNLFDPGHVVAYAHRRKTIVVTIRGTFHLRDALVDMVGRYEPFLTGFAHCGMAKAAKGKYKTLMPVILKARDEHRDYKVEVVGHSLGAGTAALLTYLIHARYPEIPIHCHAFASPCVVSLDLARNKELITSVVVGDDIVPRLSYGSLEDLKKDIGILLDSVDGNTTRIFQIIAAGNVWGSSTTARLEKMLGCKSKMDWSVLRDNKQQKILSEKLWVPGKVIHLYSNFGEYEAEESSPSLFGEIVISTRMFLDHMPDLYEAVLLEVLEKKFRYSKTEAADAWDMVGKALNQEKSGKKLKKPTTHEEEEEQEEQEEQVPTADLIQFGEKKPEVRLPPQLERRIVIATVEKKVADADILKFFKLCGPISAVVRVQEDSKVLVCYESERNAEAALSLDNGIIGGCVINVERCLATIAIPHSSLVELLNELYPQDEQETATS